MRTQEIYTLGTEDLEALLNQAIGVKLHFLVEKGYITKDQYNNLTTNYAMILKRPSFFSKAWEILKGKDERPCMIIVKQQNLRADEDKEPKEKPKIKKEGIVLYPTDFKNGKDKNEEDE